MSILEALMLVCFGIAWPVSIIKQIRSKSSKGKSPFFSYIVIVGYLCGIGHKLLYNYDFVLYLYALNAIMVAVDLVLLYRYRRMEAAEATQMAKN
ncbi:MAG: hypothetical protein RR232_02820 [Clostridia bacterium]